MNITISITKKHTHESLYFSTRKLGRMVWLVGVQRGVRARRAGAAASLRQPRAGQRRARLRRPRHREEVMLTGRAG